MTTPSQRLKQAINSHRQHLQELEDALLEFEASSPGKALSEHIDGDGVLQLLSIEEVCKALGMGKS